MISFIRCRYRPCAATFSSRYNAARHEEIFKYSPAVAHESSIEKAVAKASSSLQLCITAHSRILNLSARNVEVAFGNNDYKDMIYYLSLGGEDIKSKREQILEAAELNMKVG